MVIEQEKAEATGVSEAGQTPVYRYGIYGISLHSEVPLPLPDESQSILAEIGLRMAPASEFARITEGTTLENTSNPFRQYARLPDRSSYIRWKDLGEFVVSADGRRITCCRDSGATLESFYTYLLGQALSFALVKRGLEPQHATAVVIDGRAVAFIADCGLGKSSLAAAFLQAGYRVLTDDLLVMQSSADGMMAYPGPARIKLFPKMAKRLLGKQVNGVPMNSFTPKMIVPLGPDQVCATRVPLDAMYVLAPPDGRQIRFQSLSRREAFLALVENTFNYLHVDADRLARQFSVTARLADTVPVKKLFYPRVLSRVPALRDAILADVKSGAVKGLPCHFPSPSA